MKKHFALLATLMVLISILNGCSTTEYEGQVTLYTADGQEVTVDAEEVDDYLYEGWYDEPVTVLYHDNDMAGRIFTEKEAKKAIEKGWRRDVPVQLFNIDGDFIRVWEEDVEKYESEGWRLSRVSHYMIPYGDALKDLIKRGITTDSAQFALVYIDGDDVPELVYRTGQAHVDGVGVFTYYDYEAYPLTFKSAQGEDVSFIGSWGDFTYAENENVIISSYMNQGIICTDFYEICEDGVSLTDSLYEAEIYLEDGQMKKEYKINGESVIEEEYQTKLDERNNFPEEKIKSAFGGEVYKLDFETVDKMFW